MKSYQFVYLNHTELCFTRFCYQFCYLLSFIGFVRFDFLANSHFYNKFFLNLNGLSDGQVASFTKT